MSAPISEVEAQSLVLGGGGCRRRSSRLAARAFARRFHSRRGASRGCGRGSSISSCSPPRSCRARSSTPGACTRSRRSSTTRAHTSRRPTPSTSCMHSLRTRTGTTIRRWAGSCSAAGGDVASLFNASSSTIGGSRTFVFAAVRRECRAPLRHRPATRASACVERAGSWALRALAARGRLPADGVARQHRDAVAARRVLPRVDAQRRIAAYAGSAVVFALSILTKETFLLFLPALVVAVWSTCRRRRAVSRSWSSERC